MSKKKTAGAASIEAKKNTPISQSPVDLEKEMHQDYVKNIMAQVEEGMKLYPEDFYIVVLTAADRLLDNVLKCKFLTRASCPTPDWDQAVYKFEKKQERILFLWVLPSQEACEHLTEYAKQVVPAERRLLDFVLKLNDGTLLKIAKHLNGEVEDSPLLEK